MEENARGERDMSFTGNMGRKTQDKVDSSKASQDTWIKRCKVSHMSENMQNKGKICLQYLNGGDYKRI